MLLASTWQDQVPPTLNVESVDDSFDLDYVRGSSRSRRYAHVHVHSQVISSSSLVPFLKGNVFVDMLTTSRVDVALSNSFGFGGTNASLCFTKYLG